MEQWQWQKQPITFKFSGFYKTLRAVAWQRQLGSTTSSQNTRPATTSWHVKQVQTKHHSKSMVWECSYCNPNNSKQHNSHGFSLEIFEGFKQHACMFLLQATDQTKSNEQQHITEQLCNNPVATNNIIIHAQSSTNTRNKQIDQQQGNIFHMDFKTMLMGFQNCSTMYSSKIINNWSSNQQATIQQQQTKTNHEKILCN